MSPFNFRIAVACGIALMSATSHPVWAQPASGKAAPAVPVTAKEGARTVTRSTALPAKGLFVGDQLSDTAKQRLTDLVIDALGLDVEVALLVPTGPWQIDGTGDAERRLTPARLEAVKRYLTQRGVDPKRIVVESRIDARVSEPQLVVEMVGRPSRD